MDIPDPPGRPITEPARGQEPSVGSQSPPTPKPHVVTTLLCLSSEMTGGPLSVLLTHCLPLGVTHSRGSINELNGK